VLGVYAQSKVPFMRALEAVYCKEDLIAITLRIQLQLCVSVHLNTRPGHEKSMVKT